MIKLKLRHLNSEIFQKAITKLTKSASFSDFKSSYNMAKIARKVWNETRTAHEAFTVQVGSFYEKDDKGAFIPASKEQMAVTGSAWKIKEGEEKAYVAKLEEMLDADVEIDCQLVEPSSLDSAGITPQEAIAIEPILALDAPQVS